MAVRSDAGAEVPVFTSDGTRSTKYERIAAVSRTALGAAFTSNSTKEALLLQYVRHFEAQFTQLYPNRRPLLLCPANEAGVPKFVCTTLRPTLLPFKELYDLGAAARFVAAYIHYEPLDEPCAVPEYLPSPFFTLQTRAGDAFDMATLLASYLLGAGFDAYVVCGTAPRWITLRQEDRSKCEWTPPADLIDRDKHTGPAALGLAPPTEVTSEPAGVSRYRLPPPPALTSSFAAPARPNASTPSNESKAEGKGAESDDETSDQEIERLRRETRARRAEAEAMRARAVGGMLSSARGGATPLVPAALATPMNPLVTAGAPPAAAVDEDEDVDEDALHGTRVHAWVLVRAGRRDVIDHCFVEPSTGHIYSARASPYLSVESAWNNKNYFVNMQAQPLLPAQAVGNGGTTGLEASMMPMTGRSTSRGATWRSATPGGVDASARFKSPYAASLDTAGFTSVPAGAPKLAGDAVPRRPPLRGELAPRGDGTDAPAQPSLLATATADAVRAASRSGRAASRSRNGRKQSRGMSRGRDVASLQGALQSDVADMLARQSSGRSMSELAYDFMNADDWEYVMIPLDRTGSGADTVGLSVPTLPSALRGLGGGSGSTSAAASRGGLGMSALDGVGTPSVGDGDGLGDDDDAALGSHMDGGDGMDTPHAARGDDVKVMIAPGVRSAPDGTLLERDGEHILDLPQSWCPRLVLDRFAAQTTYITSLSRIVNYFRARLEFFPPHSHPHGMVTRFFEYHDTERTRVQRVTEVFARRADGLYKRVRHLDTQTVEQHFEKDHFGGVGCSVEVLGKRQELYLHAHSRIDGLLKRVHEYGHKIQEFYGDTPDRLWYRSITLLPTSGALPGVGGAKTRASGMEDMAGALTLEVAPPRVPETEEDFRRAAQMGLLDESNASSRRTLIPVEQTIRKMTEKYRRDPTGATPAHADMAKVVYLVDANAIQVTFHHAAGRITACARLYQKPTGKFETLSADPYAPQPRPFHTDNEYRRLLTMERDCHAAARSRARTALEILSNRVVEESNVKLEKTIFEIAMERARSGAPLENEPEKRAEAEDIDFLLPFLLSAKCADPNNPGEKEARKADRECRAAYKERLLERVAIIQKRLEAENDDLLRRQQAFSRNRDHTEGAEEEFEKFCAEATFRINILEQRLERQEALVTKKYQELEQRLANDPRLAIIHNPAALAARNAKAAGATAAKSVEPTAGTRKPGAPARTGR